MTETNQAIVKLTDAVRLLAEVKTIQDAQKLIGLAEAARVCAQQFKLGSEAQNYATEIKIRAERFGGAILAQTEMNKGSRGRIQEHLSGDTPPGIACAPPKLSDLGISLKQSSRWQLEASVPEDVFERHVAEVKAKGEELTTASVLQLASRMQRQEVINDLSRVEQVIGKPLTYRCIVIDPPWPVQKIERDVRPMQGQVLDYPTMTIDEIGAIPVLEQANPKGCHIYLWVTHKYLPIGLQLLERWGFRYQCLLTWIKNVGFTPFSWMYSTEHVLFGRVGSLDLTRMGLRLDFTGKVREHSRKPDQFYDLVRQASPGPRLEMFARERRDGFDLWGNETDRFASVAAGQSAI